MDAIKSLKQRFAFLQEDYGLEPYRLKLTKSDKRWCPAVAHANDDVGVHVVFDTRDSYLSVQIYELENGEFPMTAGGISHARGYPLNAIIFLRNENDLIPPWGRAMGGSDEGTFDEYLSNAAAKLERYSDDFLRGDFSRAALISGAIEGIRKLSMRDSRLQR